MDIIQNIKLSYIYSYRLSPIRIIRPFSIHVRTSIVVLFCTISHTFIHNKILTNKSHDDSVLPDNYLTQESLFWIDFSECLWIHCFDNMKWYCDLIWIWNIQNYTIIVPDYCLRTVHDHCSGDGSGTDVTVCTWLLFMLLLRSLFW